MIVVFYVLISTLSISINFYFESLDKDPTISKTVQNITKQFSEHVLENKISLLPQNVLYYDDYSKINRDLSRCAGSKDVNCRLNALNRKEFFKKKDLFEYSSRVTFIFISTPEINKKQDILVDYNICNSIFIINIHSENIHVLVENSLKKYIQLLTKEIKAETADKKINTKKLEEKLKLCNKLNLYDNNTNDIGNYYKNTYDSHSTHSKDKNDRIPFKYEKNQLQGKFVKIQSDSTEDEDNAPNGFLIKN